VEVFRHAALAAERFDRLMAGLIVAIEDADRTIARGEFPRGRLTDAGRAAGYHNHFVRKVHGCSQKSSSPKQLSTAGRSE
jgi:hypothetical protein